MFKNLAASAIDPRPIEKERLEGEVNSRKKSPKNVI